MKMTLSLIAKHIYSRYGNQLEIVHIFDNSPIRAFSLSGEMMITLNVAKILATIFVLITPLCMHPDIEFNNPSK